MRAFLASLLLSAALLAGCDDDSSSSTEPLTCGFAEKPTTPEQCECAGGTVRTDPVDGPARCPDGEDLLGVLAIDIGPIFCCR